MTGPLKLVAGARLREAVLGLMTASPEHPWTASELTDRVSWRLGNIDSVRRALHYLEAKQLITMVKRGDAHYVESTYRAVVEPSPQELDGYPHAAAEGP